jgi:hypothetical protein
VAKVQVPFLTKILIKVSVKSQPGGNEVSNKFKRDLDFALTQLATNGPAPGDIIRNVTGVGKVVIKSKTLPSGLILESFSQPVFPVEVTPNESGLR